MKRLTNIWIFSECWKTMEHEGDDDNKYSWSSLNNFQMFGKKTRENGNQRKDPNYTDYSIV